MIRYALHCDHDHTQDHLRQDRMAVGALFLEMTLSPCEFDPCEYCSVIHVTKAQVQAGLRITRLNDIQQALIVGCLKCRGRTDATDGFKFWTKN